MKTNTFFVLSALSTAPIVAARGKSGKSHGPSNNNYGGHHPSNHDSSSSKSGKKGSKSSKSSKPSKGSKSSQPHRGGNSSGDGSGYGGYPSKNTGRALHVTMNKRYPDYTGDISPSGSVTVTFPRQDTIEFAYNFQGLESDCTNCGVHIHSGTTCDVADAVGGHYYSVSYSVPVDPWTTEGGAIYNADGDGNTRGSYRLTTGFDTYEVNLGHAVVIHGQDGTRLSCGILRPRNNLR